MLKHRLTGAAVLIGFAVVVLPMLLGGPEEPIGTEPQERASSEPERNVFRSNITPIGGDTPSVQAASEADNGAENGGDEPAGSVAAQGEATGSGTGNGRGNDQGSSQGNNQGDNQSSATAEADGEASGATEAAGADDGSEESSDSETAQTIERGWIVQVGTFKNTDNVAKLVAQLEDGGFSASTSEVDTSEGPATRVWVGPYETRVEAARHKTRVKQRTGTEGLIVAYP